MGLQLYERVDSCLAVYYLLLAVTWFCPRVYMKNRGIWKKEASTKPRRTVCSSNSHSLSLALARAVYPPGSAMEYTKSLLIRPDQILIQTAVNSCVVCHCTNVS